MGAGVFRFIRIRGIDINIHWSWSIILLLVTLQLAAGRFPAQIPGESQVTYWVLGIIGALLLFASVLLHELSHSFVATARGLKVRDITLFIFGGAANIEGEPEKASDEFFIAAVGPFTSLVLAAIFGALALTVDPPVGRVGAGAAALFQYMSYINFILALFNMIPGFPLDGGRVLRSIIWAVNKDFQAATRIAGSIGQLVAYGFIILGLYQAFFGANFDVGGLWLSFIGWFLLNAAQQSTTGSVVRATLRGVTVANIMQPSPPTAFPHITIAHLLTQYILPYNLRALPVVTPEGQMVGIVTLSDIKDIPQERWGIVTVGDVMTGSDKLKVVRPQDSLEQAMQVLGEGDFDQLPVVDQAGKPVGLLTRAGVLRWLQIREELKLKPKVPTES